MTVVLKILTGMVMTTAFVAGLTSCVYLIIDAVLSSVQFLNTGQLESVVSRSMVLEYSSRSGVFNKIDSGLKGIDQIAFWLWPLVFDFYFRLSLLGSGLVLFILGVPIQIFLEKRDESYDFEGFFYIAVNWVGFPISLFLFFPMYQFPILLIFGKP